MRGLYRALVEAGKHSVGCSSAHYQCEKESHHKALNSKRAVYVCEGKDMPLLMLSPDLMKRPQLHIE